MSSLAPSPALLALCFGQSSHSHTRSLLCLPLSLSLSDSSLSLLLSSLSFLTLLSLSPLSYSPLSSDSLLRQIFFAITQVAFVSIGSIPLLFRERIVFYKQRDSKYYATVPYAIVQFVREIPFSFLGASLVFNWRRRRGGGGERGRAGEEAVE